MKIYELIKKLNSKVSVKYSDVVEIKKYYLSMYRSYMIMMYDRGYISDPTVFDKKEILKNIVDMRVKHISGVTGKIELSSKNISFALAKNKNNEDVRGFLEVLYKALKYREMSINIDKFYDDIGLSSSSSRKKISLNIAQSASRIYTKTGYTLGEEIFKCLYGFGYSADFISLNEVIYDIALDELGLSTIGGDEALFVKGLSREEEINHCDLILNGLVSIDGKYADELVSWLKNNKWSGENKFSSQNEGLYNWITIIKTNNMIEIQSKLLNKLIDEGKEIVGIETNGYYVLNEVVDVNVPIGVFSVSSTFEGDTVLPEINRLEGYTGEVYSVNFLNKNCVCYVGCPIELYYRDTKKCMFVDKEQTDMRDSISWFKHIGATISFDENYDCNRLPEGTLGGKLQTELINSERGLLIGNMSLEDYQNLNGDIKRAVINSLV